MLQYDTIVHDNKITSEFRAYEDVPSTMARPHSHNSYEIYFLIKGARRYFIQDALYSLVPGNLILIQPNVIHRTLPCEDDKHERLLINFNMETLKPYTKVFEGMNFFEVFENKGPLIQVGDSCQEQLADKMKKVFELYTAGGEEVKKASMVFTVMEILMLINEKGHSKQLESPLADDNSEEIHKRILDVVKYINGYYHEPLTIKSLAGLFYISHFYLSRHFHQVTGFYFKEYLNQVRIKEAKELILNTDFKIHEIALKVGYENQTHFGRVFKGLTGVTPLTYRKHQ